MLGPLVEDPVQSVAVVAAQLAQLSGHLRRVRERQWRIGWLEHVEPVNLVVDDRRVPRGEAVDELVDGLLAVAIAVLDGLHALHLVKR